jgi:hypothetical protein
MEARMTSEKLQKIVIWVAAHEDIVELAAKVRDKRMVYRPITEEHGHWGRVIEQRMLRTTTVDLVSGENRTLLAFWVSRTNVDAITVAAVTATTSPTLAAALRA